MKHYLSGITLALLSTATMATPPIQITGTLDTTIKINSHGLKATPPKKIKLMAIKLKNNTALLDSRLNQKHLVKSTASLALPSSVDIGMNDVPVLDQGQHGTCVTFAVSAAIDSFLPSKNPDDYISQFCSLQLGKYLSQQSYQYSGWGGSWGKTVINQFEINGYVPHKNESVCGGTYSISDPNEPEGMMTLEQYHANSLPISAIYPSNTNDDNGMSYPPIYVKSLLDIDEYATDTYTNTESTLNNIKTALNNKQRVVFGVFLTDLDNGLAGAVGTFHESNDAWVLSDKIMRDLMKRPGFFAGHEMIIIGYDDNAIAIDDLGKAHKGLLKIRNSWGSNAGDKGDFYMSYDYFKMAVIEAKAISTSDVLG
jgi:C1A family cysteine protease